MIMTLFVTTTDLVFYQAKWEKKPEMLIEFLLFFRLRSSRWKLQVKVKNIYSFKKLFAYFVSDDLVKGLTTWVLIFCLFK